MGVHEGFDLDRSIDYAWQGFQGRLAEVLSMMDATEPLTLSSPDGSGAVDTHIRFVAPSRDRLLALVPGDVAPYPERRPTEQEAAALAALGWRPPSPTADPETAGAYWAAGAQARSEELAGLAVRTLRGVFGVRHPVFLDTDVLAEILQGESAAAGAGELVAAPRGDAHDLTAVLPKNAAHLGDLVAAVLRAAPDITPVRDADGDLAIRVGSAMVFVRVPADACEVLVFAPLVHDVDGRSRAMEVLNDINSHARWVRFALLRDRVFVSMSILARPFVPAHLRQAIAEVCKVADGVDDLLAQSLHGRTTFTAET
ncbi:MAG: YbjN domain-containing protein [Propionibacteriaceae bacterium]|jgi:hypothetical protein|nr:YbjN domain-containing protein [Propionibacteriaceae bacterium]